MSHRLAPTHPYDDTAASLISWDDLEQAIDREELELHYQPIVHLADGSLGGFAALVRWPHPTFGLLSAERFIGLAESKGLIHQLDGWVLETVSAQLAAWQESALVGPEFLMTIHVSPTELVGRSLVDRIRRVIESTGVDPMGLVVELTERAGFVSLPPALESVTGLQQLGVRLAIDDFGSENSSFSRSSVRCRSTS